MASSKGSALTDETNINTGDAMYNVLQLRLAIAVNGKMLDQAIKNNGPKESLLTQRAILKDMLIDKLLEDLNMEKDFDKLARKVA